MIHITKKILEKIEREGETAFPNECCGFLMGRDQHGDRFVEAVIPALNAREEEAQRKQYLITSDLLMKTEKTGGDRGMDVIGFFHSHPNVAAQPSTYDTEHAWPWYSYLITSIREGVAAETTSWRLRDDRSRFNEEELNVSGNESGEKIT